TRGDLDVGLLATFGAARIGLTVKNLTTPMFGAGDDRLELDRQVRAGAAVVVGARGRVPGVTAAIDADLTTARTLVGDERHLAVGAEVWTPGRRFGARGGASLNTIGDARAAASGGFSAAVRPEAF